MNTPTDTDKKPLSKDTSYPYRIHAAIDDDRRRKLDDLIPWGMKERILRGMIDMLISLLERADNKEQVLGAIMGNMLQVSIKEEYQTDDVTGPKT